MSGWVRTLSRFLLSFLWFGGEWLYSVGLVFITGSGFSVFSGSGNLNFGFLVTGFTLVLGECCWCWFLFSIVIDVAILVPGLLVFGEGFWVDFIIVGLGSTDGLGLGLVPIGLGLGLVPVSLLTSVVLVLGIGDGWVVLCVT